MRLFKKMNHHTMSKRGTATAANERVRNTRSISIQHTVFNVLNLVTNIMCVCILYIYNLKCEYEVFINL